VTPGNPPPRHGIRRLLRAFWRFLEPEGSSSRVFIGLYMSATGIMRIITGNTPAKVNIFSARMFGVLLLCGGIVLLLTTRHKWRCHWPGRIAAIICAALWLLAIAQALPAAAWVSITGACMFTLALGNEVRIHEC
jgi:hypothetical protein